MNILMSLLIGCFLCFVVYLQVDEYNRIITAKFKFRFFALRDRLALLVVTGQLKEESWEYQEIVSALNFHISAIEKLSLIRIIELLSEYHTSSEEERRVQMLKRSVEREDLKKIMTAFFATTYELIQRNSRAQIALIMLVARIARIFHREPTKALKDAVPNPSHALNAIKSHSEAFGIAG